MSKVSLIKLFKSGLDIASISFQSIWSIFNNAFNDTTFNAESIIY